MSGLGNGGEVKETHKTCVVGKKRFAKAVRTPNRHQQFGSSVRTALHKLNRLVQADCAVNLAEWRKGRREEG